MIASDDGPGNGTSTEVKIAVKSPDMWSLGCVFLEFLTRWFQSRALRIEILRSFEKIPNRVKDALNLFVDCRIGCVSQYIRTYENL